MEKFFKEKIRDWYDIAFAALGPQYWWPGDTRCEIMVGAVLTQNTAWQNVEKAIDALKKENLLDWDKILSVQADLLASTIKSSGYYNQKAVKLKNLAAWFRENSSKYENRSLSKDEMRLFRKELLGIKGIGPETADSILLYGYDLPFFCNRCIYETNFIASWINRCRQSALRFS